MLKFVPKILGLSLSLIFLSCNNINFENSKRINDLDILNEILVSIEPQSLLRFDESKIENNFTISFDSNMRIVELDFSNHKFQHPENLFKLNKLKELRNLDLSDCVLSELCPLKLEKFELLNLSNNFLTKLPQFENLGGLTHVNLGNNELQGHVELSFINNQKLKYINLSHNLISEFSLSSPAYLNQVMDIILMDNKIRNVDSSWGKFLSVFGHHIIFDSNDHLEGLDDKFRAELSFRDHKKNEINRNDSLNKSILNRKSKVELVKDYLYISKGMYENNWIEFGRNLSWYECKIKNIEVNHPSINYYH